MYGEFFSNLELKRKMQEKLPSAKQKKEKKKEKQSNSIKKEGKNEKDPDFSEIDYSDLLDDEGSGFDDLIDDGDLD